MAESQKLPILVVAVSASVWGLFWLPLRRFEAAGLAAGWASFAQFAAAVVLLLPLAIWRATRSRPTGVGHVVTALFMGGAFALYANSLLLTEVARSLLLFYMTPVWSTILEATVMGQRLTTGRVVALGLGLLGLLVTLGGKTGIPLPRNLGDVMAIVSGILWSFGTMRVRRDQGSGVFEHLFSFFLYGGAVALVIALLPLGVRDPAPSAAEIMPLLPWLLMMAVGFVVPVTCGLLWGSQRLDPGRLGILLQLEAVVGVLSAALLTKEPFGLVELAGSVLVIGAGAVDILGSRVRAEGV